MNGVDTLLLSRNDVARLLSIEECIDGVETAFRRYAEGTASAPKLLGIHTDSGGFHIKAGILGLSKPYFVAKMNANFPRNRENHLPTIQGVVIVCDGTNGKLLALMDSIEITIIRTGAATAVAAKYLARQSVNAVTVCGCGNQGRISLQALSKVRNFKHVFAFDIDQSQVDNLQMQLGKSFQVSAVDMSGLNGALRQSQIVVTCTPSRLPFIRAEDISPGTFVAAVGADSEEKQELCADFVAATKVVADVGEQSASIGEVHHAIKQNRMRFEDIYSELGTIIAGRKKGRESENEIIIFDSTGMALQDVAAAAIVYEKALTKKIGPSLNFSAGDNMQRNYRRYIDVLRAWYPFR